MSLDLPVGWLEWPKTLLLSLMKDLSQRRTNVCLEVTIKRFRRENNALFPSKPSPSLTCQDSRLRNHIGMEKKGFTLQKIN